MIDGFRYGFIGEADSHIATGVVVMLAVNVLFGVLVYRAFRTGWRIKA